MSFCAHCGSELEEEARFCSSCGAPVHELDSEEGSENVSSPSFSPAPETSSGNRRVWIIVGAGCGGLAVLGLISSLVIYLLFGTDPEPAGSKNPEVMESAGGLTRNYQELTFPEVPLVVRIPEGWETLRQGSEVLRFQPSPGDPEASRAWAEVRPFANRVELSRDEIANALSSSVRELKDLELLNFFPMETFVGGEPVTVENPKKPGDITLTSYLMEVRYTDETTGRPFRGYSIVSTQSSDLGRKHYLIAFRCDVDLWEEYVEVFTQFLGYIQLGITPE